MCFSFYSTFYVKLFLTKTASSLAVKHHFLSLRVGLPFKFSAVKGKGVYGKIPTQLHL